MPGQPPVIRVDRGPLAVCYLARCADGAAPVARFAESYRAHPAGIDHDLVVLFKGFADPAAKGPWREALAGLDYRELDFDDVGFTDVPFRSAAATLPHDRFLFANTWSRILAPDWLAIMAGIADRPGVGVVGATASCESHFSTALAHHPGGRSWASVLASPTLLRWWRAYAPFPNFHLRTSGYLVSKRVMARIKLPPVRTKEDAYRFESGRSGFTRQIRRMGLAAVVAGRDGAAFGPDDILRSGTFRLGEQENLLIGDNQTELYARADPGRREALRRAAWGDPATGRPPETQPAPIGARAGGSQP